MKLAVASEADVVALGERIAELEARLAQVERARLADDLCSPMEVAKRFRVRKAVVYDALSDGHLVADVRPRAGGIAYRIRLADAQTWYDRHVRRTNQ